jgi:pyruvate carboxylase
LPNIRVALEAVHDTHAIAEAAICYTGNILDPRRDKYPLEYYVKLAKEVERMGAHSSASGHGRTSAPTPRKLVKALRDEIGLPIHLHTRDSSGVNAGSVLRAADAGLNIADAALASMSGSTSQPNLNSSSRPPAPAPRNRSRPRRARRTFRLLEYVRDYYAPFDTAPRTGSAEVYLHEMPGGQYTNLKEQAASMGSSTTGPRSPALTPR